MIDAKIYNHLKGNVQALLHHCTFPYLASLWILSDSEISIDILRTQEFWSSWAKFYQNNNRVDKKTLITGVRLTRIQKKLIDSGYQVTRWHGGGGLHVVRLTKNWGNRRAGESTISNNKLNTVPVTR